MSIALQCLNLTSGYSGVPAVRGIDLDLNEGEIVAILGPNGSGKTTTLLTLMGVLHPIEGHVAALGEPIIAGKPHLAARRGVSLVPDDRALIYGLTAQENLTIGLKRRARRAAVDLVLDYFPPLRAKLSTSAGLLSGGEQQMLALGRAFARGSKVLMIDEMTLGLAPVIAHSIVPILRRAVSELGTSVLLVEQHVDLALGVADRAYVLNRGVIEMAGPAAELRGRRDLLQASYLGEVTTLSNPPGTPGRVPADRRL
jgi:branched-chain amino acid transport system ATP-binding protein